MNLDRADYLRRLLDLYCGLPSTAARRPFPPDRRLANQLFDRGIPLERIETALRLAVARRTSRDPEAPPLPLIRSLAYFLPTLDEVLRLPHDPGYLDHLRRRVEISVQKSTDLDER